MPPRNARPVKDIPPLSPRMKKVNRWFYSGVFAIVALSSAAFGIVVAILGVPGSRDDEWLAFGAAAACGLVAIASFDGLFDGSRNERIESRRDNLDEN